MFSFLKADPAKKLKKEYQNLLQQAMHSQRNGDIKAYSRLTSEAEAIYKQLQQLEQSGNKT
ncbi:DUF6435 family protein [Bermanella sp. R86510]|uniref:DUF6435 family protein n=1 Tax=unclassified Bermanella TaxID=2627862 RepID=UPI0037C5DABC